MLNLDIGESFILERKIIDEISNLIWFKIIQESHCLSRSIMPPQFSHYNIYLICHYMIHEWAGCSWPWRHVTNVVTYATGRGRLALRLRVKSPTSHAMVTVDTEILILYPLDRNSTNWSSPTFDGGSKLYCPGWGAPPHCRLQGSVFTIHGMIFILF